MKLAEMLLRRKELQAKVDEASKIKQADVFEARVRRVNVSDGIDEVTADVPKLSLAQVTAEYDHYAKRLRLIDGAIQRANWETDVESVVGGVDVFEDWSDVN